MPSQRKLAFQLRDGVLLLLLTALAFLVHGYHPFSEDAAFHIPPVERLLDPALFPRDAGFFEPYAALTLFPQVVAGCVRLSHMRIETVLLILQLLCLYLFLAGCWRLSRACFEAPEAQWASVGLVAAVLTLPAGATTILLFDPYLNPRSFSSCAGIFALAFALERKYLPAILLLVAAGLMHPLMALYTGFLLLLLWRGQMRASMAAMAALFPFGISFDPPTPAYHRAALLHSFHYVQHWSWYEWLGVWAPIGLFIWFGAIAKSRRMIQAGILCRSLVLLLLCSLAAALVLDLPPKFEALARLQPMRSMHLIYILMFILLGGVLGQYVLQRSLWRWLFLFVPICAGMASVQLWMYPASAHVEWPGVVSRNDWVRAFEWIRDNTPRDAYFALDPDYLDVPSEDHQAFRPIAERSMLADLGKDSGAVSMFPSLAETWWDQVQARRGWKAFQVADLQGLKQRYGVTWVVLQEPGLPELVCPYHDQRVLVCRVD